MHRLIYLFFFLSGFSSLVFEVLWERLLMQVFGSTTFAIATLLTAFMAGLALGSWAGGKLTRLRHPLLIYGLLEGAIGLYGLAVPWLLGKLPQLYGAIFTAYLDDFLLFSLLRFVAVFAILILPTMMMGATLPIVSPVALPQGPPFPIGHRLTLRRKHPGRVSWLLCRRLLSCCHSLACTPQTSSSCGST